MKKVLSPFLLECFLFLIYINMFSSLSKNEKRKTLSNIKLINTINYISFLVFYFSFLQINLYYSTIITFNSLLIRTSVFKMKIDLYFDCFDFSCLTINYANKTKTTTARKFELRALCVNLFTNL